MKKDIVKFYATQAVMSFHNGSEFEIKKLQDIETLQGIEGIVEFINEIVENIKYKEETEKIYDECIAFILL